VTDIVEIVIQAVIDNPTLIANDEDMFKYQENDYRHVEEDEEEDDYFGDDE
jgi:hypothetical protein